MSEFKKIIPDLCVRTIANLEYIYEAKMHKENVYEVTQLFNSLLGIIVNIKENEKLDDAMFGDFKSFANVDFLKSDLRKTKDWGIPEGIIPTSLTEIVYNMRNAVAHMDVEFELESSDSKKEIESINFKYIKRDSCGKMRFSIDELHKFVKKLCEHILE